MKMSNETSNENYLFIDADTSIKECIGENWISITLGLFRRTARMRIVV